MFLSRNLYTFFIKKLEKVPSGGYYDIILWTKHFNDVLQIIYIAVLEMLDLFDFVQCYRKIFTLCCVCKKAPISGKGYHHTRTIIYLNRNI